MFIEILYTFMSTSELQLFDFYTFLKWQKYSCLSLRKKSRDLQKHANLLSFFMLWATTIAISTYLLFKQNPFSISKNLVLIYASPQFKPIFLLTLRNHITIIK